MRACNFGAARRVTPRTGRACCSLWTMHTAIGRSGANRRWLTASVCVCVHLSVRVRFELFLFSLSSYALSDAHRTAPRAVASAQRPRRLTLRTTHQ